MKVCVLIFSLLVSTLSALAQGKVSLQMDLPIIFGPPGGMLPSDVAFGNQPVPNNGTTLPSHIYMVVGLYGGTSSSSLTLQGTAVLNPPGGNGTPDGFFLVTHIITTLPGGVLGYFQVKLWDSAYATYEAQAAAGHVGNGTDYSAFNNIFTMTPSGSISYPPINGGGGSTWVAAGNETPLLIYTPIPEPSAFALIVLATATLVMPGQRMRFFNH